MTNNEQLNQKLRKIIPDVKHCEALGIDVLEAGEGKLKLILPYSEKIIGNPETRVIDGGAITTLMDTVCGFSVICALGELIICPTLDLRIDYMKSAEPGKAIIGEAQPYHFSSNVIFTRGIAYHEGERDSPIAMCTANFMKIDPENVQINMPVV